MTQKEMTAVEKQYVDLSELSREIGCTFREVSPAPGVVIRQTHWNREQYEAAKASIKARMEANPQAPLSIYGSPDPWNTVALVRELGITYTYPFPEHPEALDLDLKLQTGSPAYNYDVRYEIREDGDSVYINMTSDNPELPRGDGTPHTFTIANIPKVSAPEIAPGKDVYLHAWGMYGVMCSVAATLAETARSVFLACHDTDYFCCAAKTPEHQIGDSAPRTWENTLLHC